MSWVILNCQIANLLELVDRVAYAAQDIPYLYFSSVLFDIQDPLLLLALVLLFVDRREDRRQMELLCII